jgi:hypothetical protein
LRACNRRHVWVCLLHIHLFNLHPQRKIYTLECIGMRPQSVLVVSSGLLSVLSKALLTNKPWKPYCRFSQYTAIWEKKG